MQTAGKPTALAERQRVRRCRLATNENSSRGKLTSSNVSSLRRLLAVGLAQCFFDSLRSFVLTIRQHIMKTYHQSSIEGADSTPHGNLGSSCIYAHHRCNLVPKLESILGEYICAAQFLSCFAFIASTWVIYLPKAMVAMLVKPPSNRDPTCSGTPTIGSNVVLLVRTCTISCGHPVE